MRREVGGDLQPADAVAVDERARGRETAPRPGSRTRAAARRGSRRRRRGSAAGGSGRTPRRRRRMARRRRSSPAGPPRPACRSGSARRPRSAPRRRAGRRGSARPRDAAEARPAPGSPRTRSSRGSCWCASPATRRCGRPLVYHCPPSVVARLEHRHVEARLERVLGGDEADRSGADDRDPSALAQPHGATLTRTTLRARVNHGCHWRFAGGARE